WSTHYTDKFIMDRNFGAASATRADGLAKTRGLYYQFGRKDPFPAASVQLYNVSGATVTAFTATPSDCIVRVEGRTAIKVAVQYPYNFYAPGSDGGDWVSDNPYGDLWNNPAWHSSTTKSFFDPCPPGWRLPVNGAWDTFALPGTNTSNAANYPSDYRLGNVQAGWEFYMSGFSGETAFYPAPGIRNSTTGAMSNERSVDYTWAATLNSNAKQGRTLHFYADGVYPQYAIHRGSGCPVRCIQE
ncbi:MAG: hypothetical protein LBP56_01475, partial [Odoribacteraceae bacterium]|nr:hypothetical protein [Odoribacteraceae bacterium]